MLPLDIFQEIAERANFLTKIRLMQTCKEIRKRVKIRKIPWRYQRLLTDEILKYLPDLHTLDASRNNKITNKGIRHLTNLQSLYASYNTNITNEGIKHLNLHILDADRNKEITDEGIRNMTNLHILFAPYSRITHELKDKLRKKGCKVYG